MRCFIAIILDDLVRRAIDSAMVGLRSGKWDVKWVRAENLHITLKFLGEITADLAEKVTEVLSGITKNFASFDLGFRSIGMFPHEKSPRVVWIGIDHPEECTRLQLIIEENLLTVGFNKDNRPFSPHLTIGRVRSMRSKDSLVGAMVAIKERDFGNISVDSIYLMKSELKPAGAQYSVITEFPLKKEER